MSNKEFLLSPKYAGRCSSIPGADNIGPKMINLLVLALVSLLGSVAAVPKPYSDIYFQGEDRSICFIWDDNFCLFDTDCA